MSHSRSHLRIPDKDYWEAYPKFLKRNGHSAVHLAENMIQFSKLRGQNMNRLQRRAIVDFHRYLKHILSDRLQYMSDTHVVKEHFSFFNNMFFFGSLYDHCILEMKQKHYLKAGKMASEKSEFSARELIGLPPKWYKIRIYNNPEPSRRLRLPSYLGSLLHEMVHVFLELYACDAGSCCDAVERSGKSGHGWAWQDIALALEIASKDPELLDLDLDLNRTGSMALEMVVSKLDLPGHELKNRWGLHHHEVKDAVIRLQERRKGVIGHLFT